MTRTEMEKRLAADTEIDKKTCGVLIDLLQEKIVAVLCKDGRFTQNGFGSFSVSTSNERIGVNPHTGEKMRYPKKRKLKFKASQALKDGLNE